jgi:hypothetical protein
MKRVVTIGVLVLCGVAAWLWVRSRPEAEALKPPRRSLVRHTRRRVGPQVSRRDLYGAPRPLEAAGDASPVAVRDDAAAQPAPPKGVIPGEHILAFHDARDRDAFIALARARGATILGVSDFGNAVRIRMGDDDAFRRLVAEGPTPVSQGPNMITRIPKPMDQDPRKPEDNYLGFGKLALQWLGVGEGNAQWGAGTTVAIVDTGIASHPALGGTRLTTVDLLGGAGDVEGAYAGHGTAVASLIGGASDDVRGMAPGADLLGIEVMSPDGTGDAYTMALGIVEAVNRGANVINLSLGTHGDSFFLRDAVAYAQEHGAILVAATGNDAIEGVFYPAAYGGVLAVTAVDGSGRHMYFANRGPEVDLAAPGVGVHAAGIANDVVNFSGTSAAVPFVSGALAMLLAENPNMSAADAAQVLIDCANDVGAPGQDDEFGAGILDLGRVQYRNQPGIYDVASGYPYLPPGSSSPTIVLYVQNRGTEPLSAVDLQVEINGVPSAAHFYNIGVGETASREFDLDERVLREDGSVTIWYQALIDGEEDLFPGNNRPATVTVSLPR